MNLDKTILLLGHTGKMGTAIKEVFSDCKGLVCRNSRDFDAADFNQVDALVEEVRPDIVINTVAFLGIDPCEVAPEKAFRLNTLYPGRLARLASENGFMLVHFSTDAVFRDLKCGFYTEADLPCPVNLYGITKYGGDCIIQSLAGKYYVIRIPILFGPTCKNDQFVEKMLSLIENGRESIRISDDIISSPSYSIDIAEHLRSMILNDMPAGLYHVANEGQASLYELMKEIVTTLGLDVMVEPASYRDFPYIGVKNTRTPIRSQNTDVLRPWRQAVRDYCRILQPATNGE